MLRSMTGFGRGVARAGQTEATVEIRSVNGRFAEVSVRGPRSANAFEPAIQARCKESLTRGNITVNITIQRQAADPASQVDGERARAVADLMRHLRKAAGLPPEEAPITLEHLLRFPEVISGDDRSQEAGQAESWAAVEPALETALDALDAMRVEEGRALVDELTSRVDQIEANLAAVEARAPKRIREAHTKLRERLAELLADTRIAGDRLELEIALLADRLDVTEECVRLRSHLAQFTEALGEQRAVGRRLNFLAQEFNREINTIASKANDADIARRAVAMKEDLEKIREQVQNVV